MEEKRRDNQGSFPWSGALGSGIGCQDSRSWAPWCWHYCPISGQKPAMNTNIIWGYIGNKWKAIKQTNRRTNKKPLGYTLNTTKWSLWLLYFVLVSVIPSFKHKIKPIFSCEFCRLSNIPPPRTKFLLRNSHCWVWVSLQSTFLVGTISA